MLKRFLESKTIWLVVFAVVATLSIAANLIYKVDESRCIGCRICEQVCPVNAIEIVNGKAVIDPDKCIGCGLCVAQCPTGAISLQQNAMPTQTPNIIIAKDSSETEREKVDSIPTEQKQKTNKERKKNALPKTSAQNTSSKTQQKQIEKTIDTIQRGITTTLPGTLKAVEETSSVIKAIVDSSKCIGCKLCISRCPVGAIEIVNGKAIIDPDKCIGCGMCISSCPVGAIKLIKAK